MGTFAYVTNFDSNTISVIDTATNTVVATLPVGGHPRRVAVAPDGKHAYVTHDDTGDIFVIETATNSVVAAIPVVEGPAFWVAVAPDGKHAYATNGAGVLMIDAANRTIVATVSLSVASASVAVAIAPDGQRVYVTDRLNGSVWVVDAATDAVVTTVPAGFGPFGLAVTPDGKYVYVATNASETIDGGSVQVIDTATNTVVATVPVSFGPQLVAITPDGKHAYVTIPNSNIVSVIDTATNTVVATVPVLAIGFAITPDGEHAYVASETNIVSVMDTATNTVVATVPVENGSNWVAVTPPAVLLNGQDSNEITSVHGGIRSDPEGIAAPSAVTVLTWKDARGSDRSMVLGSYLYQYDLSFSDNTRIVERCVNDDAFGHPGFGYVVSHNTRTGNSPLGKVNVPTQVATTIFSGGHHAIHRVELLYDRDKEGGGRGIKIPVIIEWFVATGRDHPVWAVNWRVGSAIKPKRVNFNRFRMDVRGPYGSLNFDGALNRDAGDSVGGVAWGDFGLSFATTDAQLTLNSPWTYNTPNHVNFCRAWTANSNAEMGIVQTRLADKEMGYPDRVVGRERGAVSTNPFQDQGTCTDLGDNRQYQMPCVGGWPYQLMNFDWDPSGGKPIDEPTGTKLIAWGSPYGWLGAPSFDLFDFSGVADGRGDRAYSTFIVVGPKQRFNADSGEWDQPGDVLLSIKDVEALASVTIEEVGPGSLTTVVPKGPGAEETKSIENGYNDTYAVYSLTASGNLLSFVFTPAVDQPVRNPILNVQNFTAANLPGILINGTSITINNGEDSGAFVSLNTSSQELWVTLNMTVDTALRIEIG